MSATQTADTCQDFTYASRSNGWTGGKCGRPVKRDGRCGIHARQVEQQQATRAAESTVRRAGLASRWA